MKSPGVLLDLWNKPTPPDRWIIKDILVKGGFLLFGGTKGIGKSIMVFNLAKDLSSGGVCWHMEEMPVAKPQRVLYLDYELGEYRLQDRAKALFKDPPPESLYYLTDAEKDLSLDTVPGTSTLHEYIDGIEPDVIIVDPVSDYMHGSDSDNSAVRDFFKNLKKIRAKYKDIAFVLVHHYGKVPQGRNAEDYDPLDINNFRGASKWTDAVDTVATVVQDSPMRGGSWTNRIRWAKTRDSVLQDSETLLYIKDFNIVPREQAKVGLRRI